MAAAGRVPSNFCMLFFACVVQARQTLWRGDKGGKMSLDGTESEEKKREETQLFSMFCFFRYFRPGWENVFAWGGRQEKNGPRVKN